MVHRIDEAKTFRGVYRRRFCINYVGIRADEEREGYISHKPNIRAAFPFREDGIDYEGVQRILQDSGLGMPPYTEWGRTRSGCFFCFYQQKIEWVRLKQHYPEYYEKAKAYEKPNNMNGNIFYWGGDESLAELEQPDRMAQIEENWRKTQERLAKRQPNRSLAQTLGGLEVAATAARRVPALPTLIAMNKGEKLITLLGLYTSHSGGSEKALYHERMERAVADLDVESIEFEHPSDKDILAEFDMTSDRWTNLILSGEAGVGKTRIVHKLVREKLKDQSHLKGKGAYWKQEGSSDLGTRYTAYINRDFSASRPFGAEDPAAIDARDSNFGASSSWENCPALSSSSSLQMTANS